MLKTEMFFRRAICFIFGHRWMNGYTFEVVVKGTIAWDRKYILSIVDCARCNKQVRDWQDKLIYDTTSGEDNMKEQK